MVRVAQLVEHRFVVPDVAGSIPVSHPTGDYNMENLIFVFYGISFGAMLFFSSVIAPKIFSVLKEEDAGKFVRSIFPAYYKFLLIMFSITVILSDIYDKTVSVYFSVTCFALLIISTFVLMPNINKSRDESNQKKFKILHLLSVIINMVILLGLLIIIIFEYIF